MINIITELSCLVPAISGTTVVQLSGIVLSLLAMTGRVTMLGIARWGGAGCSYRTVQRFYATVVPWAMLFWLLFRQHILDRTDEYLVVGDEVVTPKTGKKTHGVDRFFSSVYQQPIAAVSFFVLALVSLKTRHSFPMQVEQVVRSAAEKATRPAKAPQQAKPKAAGCGQRGRPKGSKNRNKAEVALNPELQRIQQMVCSLLTRVAAWLVLKYLVLDGHFGNNPATQMALRCGLHLVSKLRSDAALYFCYDGEPPKHGKRLYGDKLNYAHLPARYLKQTSIQAGLETRIYQAQMRHKEFAQPLNVVLIIKRNLTTNAEAHVVLFSTDLTLAYDRLIDYYTLRFQIEFNFRDAKQFWGLDDFMNTQPTAVTNAANLALFMTTLSFVLLRPFRRIQPDFSVLDLKAYCRGYKYALETMKLLPQPLDDISISTTAQKIATLGAIHPTQFPFSP